MELSEGEQLTCGAFTANGSNWVLGTSFGAVLIGTQQRDLFRKPQGYNIARVEGLMRGQDIGVTSLQLTAFTPNG